MKVKRKRASRRVTGSRPEPVDPLDPTASTFGGIKTFSSKSYGPHAILRRKEEVKDRYVTNLLSLGKSTRKLLDELLPMASGSSQGDADRTGDDDNNNDPMVVDADHAEDDPNWAYEEEAIQIRDILATRPAGYRPKDERTWAHRVQNLDENWKPVLPKLVDAFLRWRESKDTTQRPDLSDPPPSFAIDVLDFYTLEHAANIPMPDTCQTRAEALVLSGYLGTVPLQPSLAISLKTLELFRCIRMFKASFSVEAFTKVLCHYYSVPYRRAYRSSFSDAFDIYLYIIRAVAAGVSHALGRDTPNWRVLNACPPCAYRLQDEPPLTYGRLYAMDGNNSLKRLAPLGGRRVGDQRVFEESDYILPQTFVDKYANEVRSKPVPVADDDDNWDDEPSGLPVTLPVTDSTPSGPLEEGDPTDGAAVISSCTKNWKAAAAEEKKRAWGIFEETGVFASACRHGLILWLVDMVRSGELAKYPLAIVSKMLEVIQEPTLGGFDIGCTFEGTVKSSSLGKKFIKSGSRICVNAFHGYSHNYQCQLRNHPNIIRGIGLEDLELMERLFSASNHLAAIVRYASAYRRRVLIDAFMRHWDEEKYQNLGLMLYNNYRQALEILGRMSIELSDALTAIGATVEKLREYREEELRYFEQLGEEQPEDLHAIAYVEMLQELADVSAQLDDAEERFLQLVPANYTPTLQFLQPVIGSTTYDADASATRKTETRRRFLRERQTALVLEVTALEVKLGIKNRWQPGDPQYIKVKDYITTRKYHRALGVLQRLVVQRLFELHRLNLAQTGYRIRTHIAKHLQARCRAIRNAVNNYNTAAAAMNPPRAPLDWAQVSHMSFVEEFELLNDTRGDLRDKPWKQPLVREAMRIAHRLERAQEEVLRVNVEVRRLHTAINDEDVLFEVVLDDLRLRSDIWYGPVLEHITRRQRVNARLLAYIEKIYGLEGYTGTAGPGQRAGAVFPALLPQSELRARAAASTSLSVASEIGGTSNDDSAPVAVGASAPSVVTALANFPAHATEATNEPARAFDGGDASSAVPATSTAPLRMDSIAAATDVLSDVPAVSPHHAHGDMAPRSSAAPPAPSIPNNAVDIERQVLAREQDVSDEEDAFEEQATAYVDFVASML